jgi:abhydrolase domain-containing protein 13
MADSLAPCPRPPKPKPPRSPDEHGITDFEEHFIKTKDGAVVHAWLLLHAQSQALPTIVYFHGNAGNMGFRLPHGVNLYKQCRANVLLVDYRGYGASEGKPSEAGLLEDARAVLAHVRAHPRVASDRIVLYGKSLGGAVALALAEARPQEVAALVLENTFLSIPAMVDILLPYLSMVKGLILRIGWHNDRRVGRLAHPMLFVSGLQDELVPPAHMKQLSRLATRSVWPQLYTVADGTHNDTMFRGGLAYYRTYREFLQRVLEILEEQQREATGRRLGGAVAGAGVDLGQQRRQQQDQQQQQQQPAASAVAEGQIPIMPTTGFVAWGAKKSD